MRAAKKAPEPLRADLETDGRVLRKERSRDAMVNALLELYERGVLTPTVREVAELAGLTTRTVYHHFDDMESIADEVGKRQFQRHRHLFEPPCVSGTLAERVAGIVDQRAELFETIAPVRRAARAMMHESRTIAAQQRGSAALLRKQVQDAFAQEIAACPKDERTRLIESIDLLTSWETWERLRTWQRLKVEDAAGVLADLLLLRLGRR